MKKQELTQELLKELFHYCEITGIFTFKHRKEITYGDKGFNTRFAGKQTGSLCKKTGYIRLGIYNKTYQAHRIAFLYVYGYIPGEIDHVDGIRTNNWISNLREATRSENGQNLKKARKHNKLGMLGVSYHVNSNKYVARIAVNKKTTTIGLFQTKEEAHAAYINEKRKLHPYGEL